MPLIRTHVVRVFTDEHGQHGNPLGVVLDGQALRSPECLRLAATLAYSETVFVEGSQPARLRIFTPKEELPFAGHPIVGAAWLLDLREGEASTLICPAGEVPVRQEASMTWIAGRPEWVFPFEVRQVPSPLQVEEARPEDGRDYYCWAWVNEEVGRIRARSFMVASGISEDEATGAAAVVLGARLGRTLEICQGRGSMLSTRPGSDGMIEVGGRCLLDEVRHVSLGG